MINVLHPTSLAVEAPGGLSWHRQCPLRGYHHHNYSSGADMRITGALIRRVVLFCCNFAFISCTIYLLKTLKNTPKALMFCVNDSLPKGTGDDTPETGAEGMQTALGWYRAWMVRDPPCPLRDALADPLINARNEDSATGAIGP